jgi:hypothetical protein
LVFLLLFLAVETLPDGARFSVRRVLTSAGAPQRRRLLLQSRAEITGAGHTRSLPSWPGTDFSSDFLAYASGWRVGGLGGSDGTKVTMVDPFGASSRTHLHLSVPLGRWTWLLSISQVPDRRWSGGANPQSLHRLRGKCSLRVVKRRYSLMLGDIADCLCAHFLGTGAVPIGVGPRNGTDI